MDLTVVFSSDRMSPAKREAIKIAERHGAENKNGMFRVQFDTRSKDLNQLISLCESWKLSHILIKDQEYPVSEVCEVLYCENRRKCDGRCEQGFSDYMFLLDEVEACSEDPDDSEVDSEWLSEAISDLESFEKQPDGSYKIKKEVLKNAIERSFVIPINLCDKFDLNKIFKQIDSLPDFFTILSIEQDNRSGSSFLDDDEREKILETARLVAPIFAKAVAKELEYVIIAHFGSEKTALDYAKKADAYYSLERYSESLDYYNKAIELDPKNAEIWYSKALLLEIGVDDYNEAITAYSRAYEIDNNNLLALHNIGICYESLGKNDDAIAMYEKTIGLYEKRLKENPNDGKVIEELGITRECLSALKK